MLKMPNFVEYARNDPYSITSHFFFHLPVLFLFFYYATILMFVFVSRERQVTWLRAATAPETGPEIHSSHMWTKTNSRALRRIHVGFFWLSLFFILTNQCTFLNKHLQHSDFINLLDNYEMSTGVSETVTSEELQENRLFIDSIMKTDVMKVR